MLLLQLALGTKQQSSIHSRLEQQPLQDAAGRRRGSGGHSKSASGWPASSLAVYCAAC